ncbi:MAG: HD domain-containing protein, partial [Alphaproteobacteria bacterium]
MDIVKPWGKLEFDDNRQPCGWQKLADHCHDEAAVFAALLRLPGIRRRLAKLAGGDSLDEVTCARLAVLSFLHDF